MADVVIPIGGLGTQQGYGRISCVDKAVWQAGTPSDFMGPNGEALFDGFDIPLSDNGNGTWTLNSSGSFANAIDGMYCFIQYTALNTPGMHKILSHTNDNLVISGTSLTGVALTTAELVTIVIGGAHNADTEFNLQVAFDSVAQYADGTTNTIDILINKPEISIYNTFVVNTLSGGYSTPCRIIGCDINFVPGTKIKLKAVTGLSGTVINVGSSADYVQFHFVVSDGNNIASNSLTASAFGTDYFNFYNCEFCNATNDGLLVYSSEFNFYGCKIYGNGQAGFKSSTSNKGEPHFYNCDFYNNDIGVHVKRTGRLAGNRIWSNRIGCYVETCGRFLEIDSNTFFANTESDLYVKLGTDINYGNHNIILRNTSFSSSPKAIDISEWPANDYNIIFASIHNCQFQYTSAGYLTGIIGVTIDDLASFDCIYGEPEFVSINPVSEDFLRPAANSPLLFAGFNNLHIGVVPPKMAAANMSRVFGGL